MATQKYVCRQCEIVEEFDSRRKTHPCPRCSQEMDYLYRNEVVRGKLYSALFTDKELIIPDGVKELEWSAFEGNFFIENIVFPATLQEISTHCFSKCGNLRSITIPGTVRKINYSAFRDCRSLKEIIISEGVNEIDDNAFSYCEKLKYISLPSSLTKISNSAFSNGSTSFKIVALPEKLSSIIESFADARNALFLIAKDSKAEEFAKANDLKYKYYDGKCGFASSENIYNGILFLSTDFSEKLEIAPDIKVIFSYAFMGHTEIEEITFPDSLEEIGAYAFSGCTAIKNLSFGSGIKKIGSKAFYDSALSFIELPNTIEEIADDAFNKDCLVFANVKISKYIINFSKIEKFEGEMPWYTTKLSELEQKEALIDKNRETIKRLNIEAATLEDKLKKHREALPNEVSWIPHYDSQKAKRKSLISEREKQYNDEIQSLRAQLSQVVSEINDLSEQRKQCSFFAISRKKSIDESIASANKKKESLLSHIDKINSDYSSDISKLRLELDSTNSTLRQFEQIQKTWTNTGNDLAADLAALNEKINVLSDELSKQEKALSSANKTLDKCHKKWEENVTAAKKQAEEELKKAKEKAAKELRIAKEKAAEERRRKKEQSANRQKAKIIAKLRIPEKGICTFDLDFSSSPTDEMYINAEYKKVIENQQNREYIKQFNSFIDAHSSDIDKIREINVFLGKDENDQIEDLQKLEEPEPFSVVLPERFLKLNKYFGKNDLWKKLKAAAKGISNKKNAKLNFYDAFFAEEDYLCFSQKDKALLLFPYCAIIYEANRPMQLLLYYTLNVAAKYVDKDENVTTVPEFGELLSQRYTYLNVDGSPSRRYKFNPIIKTIRYSSILFSIKRSRIVSSPAKQYNAALEFAQNYSNYCATLITGERSSIYKSVLKGDSYSDIEKQISEFEQKKHKEKLRKVKEAEAEKQRLIEEHLAAEAAAEKARLEIVKRQRELNEERKRKAKEQAEKSIQIAKMFSDDFSSVEREPAVLKTDLPPDESHDNPIISVIGSKLITNTIFKVIIKSSKIFDSELTAYFVDEQNTAISNRKKVVFAALDESFTLGFVLNSVNNYTKMKKCFLLIENQSEILESIDFNVNIAFSPDDF